MQITSAKFEISNSNVAKCPATSLHEYAFIGRSNVGKSSLINMLTGKRKLAMTSATPGKTTLINHFLINGSWYIVDLPGYGYARRSKDARVTLERIINDYILERPQMTSLFVLVDSRHEPQKIDLEFMEWLGENGVPFAIVFTKGDKLGKNALAANIDSYKRQLLRQWEELPPIFVTSSETGLGRESLLDYIEELNTLPVQTSLD
ncbi:MAG: ribosome biogenesis GTP-binding protein YihA/YsxC [Muribaculaceae bacterium]|nr:ribosome biogenesis GTP-binding protein YihA/YsxC [Muribaculaceae bacterium]